MLCSDLFQYNNALSAFEIAHEADPTNKETLHNLGVICKVRVGTEPAVDEE